MSMFKCKMCGGTLEIENNQAVATCEYCGTQQTVPTSVDENLQSVYNRANTLRIKSEFDKAEKLYEKILQLDSKQSEAYWGLILCKYGIEYVDDPATLKKIPTCHRASFESVIADDDYKSALEHADITQRAVYEEQAKEIDRIQKEILALAQKEENYDVFICYKETDSNGQRTQDSVIANDIYYQLTERGFKVFYAAITLEGKLGSAYEPIIFAALNSAKVMLAIGTDPEHFNAVWVKNEWSRYLKIIAKDRSKLLIPCYRDMDAYELPEEFAHLQAQDMSKIGFINDVVRGIEKVIKKDEPKQTTVVKETLVTDGNANTAPLLKRAFMFLEDGEWERADEFCEQVLNLDPECAEAYLGKLMAKLRVRQRQDLKDQETPFDHRNNYKKIIRFASAELKTEIESYIAYINERNENARFEKIYIRAKILMENATTESECKAAADTFKTISEYKDSENLTQLCYEKAEVARKDDIYNRAHGVLDRAIAWEDKNDQPYKSAINLFQSIPGWKDADDLILVCEKKIEEVKIKNEENQKIIEKKKKRNKKIAIIMVPIVCAIIAFIIVLNTVIIPNGKYNDAIKLMDAGEYEQAYELFSVIRNYRDCDDYISQFVLRYDKEIYTDENGDTTTKEYSYDSNGNVVKTVSTNSNGNIETDEYSYDNNGNRVKLVSTTPSGDIITHEYSYDNNGNTVKVVSTFPSGNTSTNEYSYDNNGNKVKYVSTDSNGNVDTHEYSYDNNGNKVKYVSTDSNGNVDTHEYSYDNNGNAVKLVITFSSGNTSTNEYSYDSNGNMVKHVSTDSNGNVDTHEYSYDSNGNMVKSVNINFDGYTLTSKFSYDSKGNMVKEIFTDSDGKTLTNKYSYDSNGNMVKEVHTNPNGDVLTYEYRYDKDNNMIEEIYTSSEVTKIKTYQYIGRHVFYTP